MNTLSVSGKNWILKKYNEEEISFLKDNFSLDEMTCKLLSIRKVKREAVSSFLNPSIKNFLPNPNTLIDMDKSSTRTLAAVEKNEKPNMLLAAKAKGCSKHNTFMSVPVILIMISSHFPVTTYGNTNNWLMLGGFILIGWAVAKWMRS